MSTKLLHINFSFGTRPSKWPLIIKPSLNMCNQDYKLTWILSICTLKNIVQITLSNMTSFSFLIMTFIDFLNEMLQYIIIISEMTKWYSKANIEITRAIYMQFVVRLHRSCIFGEIEIILRKCIKNNGFENALQRFFHRDYVKS